MMAARVVAVAVLLVLAGRVNAAAAEPMTSARGHLPELAGAYKLPSKPQGTVDAAYGVLTRTLGAAAASQFTLRFIDPSPSEDAMPSTAAYCAPGVPPPCFRISGGGPGANVTIEGTGASELTAGLGMYLREYCNATIGWPRGGGSSVVVPPVWPAVESAGVAKRRSVPWSYFMNVCTHSYSLVWYNWAQWEALIDWMALHGINNVLAMTGQEEMQYKVFTALGLNDTTIRTWFNGPALLTWSRGQNEYGNDICGPLPRSWMKAQFELQKQILQRYRSLGIVGQLPGFQGNVPVELRELKGDHNITKQGDTGWMDSLDPLFGEIADMWMKQLIEDFGTDHWYQLDGYFNGGTAPWLARPEADDAALARAGDAVYRPGDPIPVDDLAYRRGTNAYMGLNRTDPDAVWSFQGWAFIGWQTVKQAAFIKGFVDATPPGKFSVIDMSVNGEGEWHKWNNASFFGANYIWTTLHDFGGTDGMKGDLAHINQIPFAGMPPEQSTNVWGTGFTPEGIDQNPIYYEFMMDAPWRTERVPDLAAHAVARARRRYRLAQPNAQIDQAWTLLVGSAYAQDLSVQDDTGVPHLPGGNSQFQPDRRTPNASLCDTFNAWQLMVAAAPHVDADLEPFRYDLVNLGREVLAQLSTPMSMNFSDAMSASTPDAARIKATGQAYVALLDDIDALVATDTAFLLGSWIAMARSWGENATDCDGSVIGITNCADFYEWNARVQLTTWNPTTSTDTSIPPGPNDYASKHWSGLVKDYYGLRAQLLMEAALESAAGGEPLPSAVEAQIRAHHAFAWTAQTIVYPTTPQGDALEMSKVMLGRYAPFYAACPSAVDDK